jgi:hypothetical protein
MSRYRTYGAKDEAPAPEGDLQFVGVDERRDPRTLPAGLAARAINKDFRKGVAETRGGFQTVAWGADKGVDFPIDFLEDHDFLTLFTESERSFTATSFRIYNGRTLQLRCAAPAGWHAIWLHTLGAYTVLAIDQNAMADSDWEYDDYTESEANFRLWGDTTFQLRNVDTGLWHTVYIDDVAGIPTLVVEQTGMPDTPVFTPAVNPNFLVRGDTTLQLRNATTQDWHTIWIERVLGIAALAIDPSGMEEEGFDFADPTGLGEVFGTCVFSDPYGIEGVLIAVRTGVVRLIPNAPPSWIRLPGQEPIEEPVRMIQAFDRVLMLRGTEKTPLVWNPANEMTAILNDFEEIEQTEARDDDPDQSDEVLADGTRVIPNVAEGAFLNNRVYLIEGRDAILCSDILDYTRYGASTGRLRISSGSDDYLVRLWPANRTTLICFKNQSIHALLNLVGQLETVDNQVLTMEYGCIAPESVASDGKDIFFFCEDGVRAIGQVLDNELQLQTEALTGPIQPIIDRINWTHADKIAGGYFEQKLYWAIPIDGVQYNNAMIVFDGITRTWMGYWLAEDMLDVHSFVRTDLAGRRRLFAVNTANLADRKAHGAFYAVGRGYADYLYDEELPIEDLLRTRGYAAESLERKRSMRLLVDQSTFNPSYDVDAVLDGVNEQRALAAGVTKSRTAYYIWGKAAYEQDNANDDHGDPYREDYSVFMDLDELDELDLGENGVDLNLHQRIQEPYRIDGRGGFVQLEIASARGRCNQHGVLVEHQAGERTLRRKA